MKKQKWCNLFMVASLLGTAIPIYAKKTSQISLKTVQQQVIKGVVRDSDGLPLPGVSVQIAGASKGTITDLDGRFNLILEDGNSCKLIFSFIGMETQTVTFSGQKELNIKLKSADIALEDVVVIGYGTKNKQSVTSSVSSVNKTDLERLAATSATLDNLLAGTMKGVQSVQTSGEPGSAPTVNVRGITSPYPNISGQGNNIPLYVIDGVPMFMDKNPLNPLLVISPNDIESIDVLKDAAATAIYGSRGANGVIIVKTKAGKKNEKVRIDAGYTITTANSIKEYEPLNNAEYRELQDEILRNTVDGLNTGSSLVNDFVLFDYGKIGGGFDPTTGEFLPYTYLGLDESKYGKENINWYDQIKNRNALSHQYNFSVQGGSDRSTYSISFNALNQDGLYVNDDLSRYSGRISVDTDATSFLKIGANMNYSYSERHSASQQELVGNPIEAYSTRPDMPVYDESGNWLPVNGVAAYGMPANIPNPLAMRQIKSDFTSKQLIASAYADLNIYKGLKLHADFNMASYTFNNNYFTPKIAKVDMFYEPVKSSLNTSDMNALYTSLNFRLDYNWVEEVHRLDAMLGYGSDRNSSDSKIIYMNGFVNDQEMDNFGSAGEVESYADSYTKGGLNSVYTRVSYDYDGRYLLEASLRGDASSKFAPDHQWGFFPAVSAGWRINNEKFLREVTDIDNLKLRLSWGRTGSTNVADFAYWQYFESAGNTSVGGIPVINIKDLLPNKDLRWEMTSEINGGIDFAFFKNRLFGSLDLYYRYTDGALAPSPHLLESGLPTYFANLIDMSNRGVEFMIGGDIIRTKDWVWNSSFNISANRNRLEGLNNAVLTSYMRDSFEEGMPVGIKKGYQVLGIAQSQEEIDQKNAQAQALGHPYYQANLTPGDYLLKDNNGDGIISVDDKDVIVNPEANFFGGWNNMITYKGFTLSFLMQFSQGAEAFYSALKTDANGVLGNSITREMFRNTWTPSNTSARYAKLVTSPSNRDNTSYNDRYVFDASYLRMKNISLSYTFPKSFNNRFRLNSGTIFVTATNLFTISSWPGLDPETIGSNILSMSENKDPYPLSRTFSVGLKLQF